MTNLHSAPPTELPEAPATASTQLAVLLQLGGSVLGACLLWGWGLLAAPWLVLTSWPLWALSAGLGGWALLLLGRLAEGWCRQAPQWRQPYAGDYSAGLLLGALYHFAVLLLLGVWLLIDAVGEFHWLL